VGHSMHCGGVPTRRSPTRVVRPDPVELNMQAPLDC
jgi:hypothetical protein